MPSFPRAPSRETGSSPLALLLLTLASPALAADEADAPKGAAVTVLTAAKACFGDIVEVSGIVIAREETMVRPERPGLKVAEILVEAGDTVTAGPDAGAADAARGRHRPGAGAGGRADRGLHGARSARWPRARARRCSRSSRAANTTWSAWCRREDIGKLAGRPDRADQDHRRRRGRRQGAPDRADGRAQQPARPGLHRHHHQPAPAGEFIAGAR